MFTVPTILTMLTRHDSVDRYDHASLRYVIYAGAPMYRADQVHALRKLGKVLVQYFGMGEVTGNITVLPPALHSENDAEMPVGSCGFPRTGMDVAILDDGGQPVDAGITGEICVRGPGVFAGYHDNPEATAKATRMAGSIPATSATWTRRASSTSPAGRLTCTYPAAPTSIRARSRKRCCCIPRSPRPAWLACRTRDGAKAASRCWCRTRHAHRRRALLAHLDGPAGKIQMAARFIVWPELPKSGYGKVTKRDVKQRLERTP